MNRIAIFKDSSQKSNSTLPIAISLNDLVAWIKEGAIIRHLLRYQEACFITYRLGLDYKPLWIGICLRVLSHKICWFQDEQGNRQYISSTVLIKFFVQWIKELYSKPSLIRNVRKEVEELLVDTTSRPNVTMKNLNLSNTPVYLRTDLWFGVRSGGSVGHITGVLNNLDCFSGKPIFITTDIIPMLRNDLEIYCIYPDENFWNFSELPSLHLNENFRNQSKSIIREREISFIYQRYSLNNYSGLVLAKKYKVPFVLEYNGSEIWVHRFWSKPLKYQHLSERIEQLNLISADVVVVVSQALKEDLVSRNINADKILINPNGIDPQYYSPDVDGSAVRNCYYLDNKVVIGFIGTFHKWHGAEVLAEAFGQLLQRCPTYRGRVRLLMIGDGPMMQHVKNTLLRYQIEDICVLTGLVPQAQGPVYLAACDILVSPHVPNPDGSRFFGSPTKLFEYMAMGKGIVASNLDQIGEILEHNRTAWMTEPGNVESLMLGLKTLIEDQSLTKKLGQAAYEEVMAKYTWKQHTQRIIEKLKERCA